MNGMKTEADVMRSAASHVDDVNTEVNAEIERVQDVAQSMRASWEGRAAGSFEQLMQRYDDAQRRLNESLADIANNIRDNAKHYENAEATNEDAFTNISSGLAL